MIPVMEHKQLKQWIQFLSWNTKRWNKIM